MKSSASAILYGCGMRAVFSAMRRSLASAATVLASSRRGARRASRLVSRTGILASRKALVGISSSRSWHGLQLPMRLPTEKRRGGAGHPSPPLRALWAPPVRLDDRRTSILVYRLLGRCLRHRYDGDVGAAFGFGSELNFSVDEREQRVVLADADIAAGMPRGAALTRDDIAGERDLAAGLLQAKAPARRSRGRCGKIRLLSCEP